MSEIRLNIDGREVYGHQGQTLLAIARQNGIEIPSLCHDERVKMYGSCGVCVVEAEGMPRLLRACSTIASDGMIIKTDTQRVRSTRQSALELLLSDHTGDCRPPCVLACPGQTDCQGYVGLIALGEYEQAIKLVKDKIPLPGAIGRVCPHPCEEACRRKLVEEPIAIANLKRFVADLDLASGDAYTAQVLPSTGKKVAVIGGGPGGLSAAYFLRAQGHTVDIYDMMPEMGGMLWYGIPEYRLPKSYLKQEISVIEKMGITFHNNIRIGKDLSLDWLRENHDAVIVAVGAWSSTALRCPGENLEGVVGGIDFLREVAMGKQYPSGTRVAVVGGGNTAMDACRTAIRLGAEKVYNIYRRTKNEMPAEQIEIIEAEQEGVIFKNLTNPIEVLGENGKANAIRLQIMELGEPDASGRRAPIAVEGKEEVVEIDTVIVAIGQKLDAAGLEIIEQTKWSTISADESTFATNVEGVFAIGDATNKGADIAISAIGEAKKAAQVVDGYLRGQQVAYKAPYLVEREVTAEEFADRPKVAREQMPHRTAEQRRDNFLEVNYGYSEQQAICDAKRCLECGCHDYFECQLIKHANDYDVKPQKYRGKVHNRPLKDDHPFIQRNPDKCILCGLCVRICDEVVGQTALGLVGRGFDTIVKPALDMPLKQTDCISCGQCVNVCPTGALTETMLMPKQVPTQEHQTLTTCSFCSVGCSTKLTHTGKQLIRSLPTAQRAEDALLCMKGRFAFGEIERTTRLTAPLVKGQDGKHQAVPENEAFVLTAKKLQSLQTVYGADCLGVAISDRYTNEQIATIKNWATNVLNTSNIFSFSKGNSALADVLGADRSTADFDELTATEMIVLIESDLSRAHGVAGMKIRRAAQNGAKLVLINNSETAADAIATARYTTGDDLEFLRGVLKAVLEQSPSAKQSEGYERALKSLDGVSICDKAKAFAEQYLSAKKAIIVFEQAKLSAQAVQIIASIALAAGKAFGARNGIIRLMPGANSQGICDAGISAVSDIDAKKIKGMFIFGEDVDLSAHGFAPSFLAVQDLHMTETAKNADVVFPGESFAETSGTFTSCVGTIGTVNAAIPSLAKFDTLTAIEQLCKPVGATLLQMQSVCTCADGKPQLLPAESGKLICKQRSTNELVKSFEQFVQANELM